MCKYKLIFPVEEYKKQFSNILTRNTVNEITWVINLKFFTRACVHPYTDNITKRKSAHLEVGTFIIKDVFIYR